MLNSYIVDIYLVLNRMGAGRQINWKEIDILTHEFNFMHGPECSNGVRLLTTLS